MNKKVFGRKLSRGRPARAALFASLIRSLLLNKKIVTTKAKAKAIRGQIESYIHLSKTIFNQRKVLGELDNDRGAVKALFEKKFRAIKMINIAARKGDNAQMARIELIEETKNENLPTNKKGNK